MVSIVIPLYNVEQYILNALHSALSQTFDDIEYILVDDCSTDNTAAVVDEIVQKNIRKDSIKVVRHQQNRGLSAARNTGMKYAHGEFVFFMDSDDEIVPDCIEKHYEAIQEKGADFTIAGIRLEGAKSIHIKPIPDEVESISLKTSYLKRMWNISACNKLYRKSFLEKNGLIFQEGLLHEDILWSYKVAFQAQKLALVKESTYRTSSKW